MWTSDEESILKTISNKCFLMSEYHKNIYLTLHKKISYFKIPIIVLSGMNSVIAVGFQSYVEQGTISAINSLLSLICGIIGSIELYLKINERMDTEYKCGRDFYILYIEIEKTLSLSRNNRSVDGKTYLDDRFNEYIQLISNAQFVYGDDAKHLFIDKKDIVDTYHSYMRKNSESELKYNHSKRESVTIPIKQHLNEHLLYYDESSGGAHSPKVNNESSVMVHSPKVNNESSLMVHSPKVNSKSSLMVHSPKVNSKSSLMVHSPKVNSEPSLTVHSPKVNSKSSLMVHSPKVNNEQSLGGHSPK